MKAELRWDSIKNPSPEHQQAGVELFEDEQRFIDHSRSPVWLSEEHVFVDG